MRELIQETTERMFVDQVTPRMLRDHWQEQKWDSGLWEMLEEAGFARALCSEEAGGAGASWSDLYPMFVACGFHHLPLPLPEATLANWLLEQAQIRHPGGLVGIADPTAKNSSSVREAAGYVPWGRHCDYILAASPDEADALLLFARNDVVLKQAVNLAREPRDLFVSGSAKPVAYGRFERASASLACCGAMMRAAQAAGAAQNAIQQTIKYAGERSQFGRPLAKFQAVQQQIASAVSEVAALNAASEYAFSCLPEQREWASAIAKITAAEASAIVCDVAHAVHGAIGYTLELKLHHATQRLRSWSMEFGNHDWWCGRLGKSICMRGACELIDMIVEGKMQIAEFT